MSGVGANDCERTGRARRGLKIALVVPSYYPESNGGAERQARLQARALATLGVEVTLIAPRLPGARAVSDEQFEVVRIDVRHLPARGGRFLTSTIAWTWKVAALVRRRRNDFDLIYVFHGRLHVLGPLIGARISGRPCVVKPGGGGANSDFKALRRKKGGYGSLAASALAHWPEGYVAISRDVAADLDAEHVQKVRIARIPNGVVVPPREVLSQALETRTGARLVFASRLVTGKGIETLIATMAMIERDDIRLTVIGDGPDRANFEAMVTELGLSQCVLFVGQVEDVYPILLSHDVFLSASTMEGQSNALLEAVACGLYPVVAPASGVREALGSEGIGRIVDDVTPRGFAAAIAEVLALTAKQRAGYAVRLNSHARATFEVDKVAHQLHDFFLRVASSE